MVGAPGGCARAGWAWTGSLVMQCPPRGQRARVLAASSCRPKTLQCCRACLHDALVVQRAGARLIPHFDALQAQDLHGLAPLGQIALVCGIGQ